MNLTVRPLKQKDAGRRLAAIDRIAAEELGLSGGDIIRVEGPDGAAIARVWPGYPEDDGTGVVRIDGRLRQEADVGIDDRVTVESVDVSRAESVTIAFPSQLRVRGQISPFIRDKLSGQPVTEGQTIRTSLGFGLMGGQSQAVPMKVASTTPSGTVVITDDTEIEISEVPAEELTGPSEAGGSGDGPDVTYEDIGGLDNELEQVRDDRAADAAPGAVQAARHRPAEGRPPARPAGHGEDPDRQGRRQRDRRELPHNLRPGDHVEVLRRVGGEAP